MKAICKVMRNPASAAALLRYLYRQRKGDAGKKNEVVSIILGSRGGRVLLVGDYAADALELAARKGKTGAGVRHVVISAESDGGDVVPKLKQAAKDWIAAYAPGRSWVFVVHTSERGHPHVHIAVEHRGDDRRGLKWSRKDVRAMSSMSFTQQFDGCSRSGKVRSQRSKVYPHAVDLDAAQLVRLIINSGMDVDAYVVALRMGVGKHDGNGTPYRVLFSGRLIRVSTLRRLYRVERQRLQRAKQAAKMTISAAVAPVIRAGGLLAQLDDVSNCQNQTKGRLL